MSPSVSIRAELLRAAMHFVAKGQDAREYPDRADIRLERSGIGGVAIIAMDHSGMFVARDADGYLNRNCTIKFPAALFDSARRAQRENNEDGTKAQVYVKDGQALLSGVSMPVSEISLPFENWRRLSPQRAYGCPPPIAHRDAERVAIVAGILQRAASAEDPGVRFQGVVDRGNDHVIATFDAWPQAYAVLSPVEGDVIEPWVAPVWAVSAAPAELRAAS